jgi:hypothetical protein
MVGGITHVLGKDGWNFVGEKKGAGGRGGRGIKVVGMGHWYVPLECDPRVPDRHLVCPKVLLHSKIVDKLTCSICFRV